jgi:methyl-accepting chemotaxis protein
MGIRNMDYLSAVTDNNQNLLQKVGFFRSIQVRLIFWFLIVGLIPLATMGIVGYVSAEKALSDRIHDGLEAVAETKAQRIEAWLREIEDDARAVAAMPAVMGTTRDDIYMGIIDIQILLEDLPESRDIYQEVYGSTYNAINAFAANYDKIDDISLISENGIVLASTDSYFASSDVSHETYFTEGIKAIYNSGALPNAEDDSTLDIDISAPIVGPDGTTIGVVLIEYNTHELQEIMEDRTGLGFSGETYLVNNDFLMITHGRFSTESTLLRQQVNTYGVEQGFGGTHSGQSDYESYHESVVVGTWRYLESEEWVLIAEISMSEAYGQVYDLRELSLIIGFGVFLFIWLLAYSVARALSRPIVQVAETASRIADGQLHERVGLQTANEIGLLAQTFNIMTDNLQHMVESERESRAYLENTVSEYMDFVRQVADGDLTTLLQLESSWEYQDESGDDLYQLGLNLNTMVDGLNRLVRRTQETAVNVATSSQQISDSAQQSADTTQQVASIIQQIAEGTAQQTDSVTGSMTTVEQLSQAIDGVARSAQEQATSIGQSVELTVILSSATQQVAASAQTGAAGAAQAAETARSGAQTVNKTLVGMSNIREKVKLSAEKVREMGQRSDHIGAIVETIDGIASQTNLLALNATIEAARAGEHGRGFAVVADEVRKLSEKSADATQEIGALIRAIQNTIGEAIQTMEEGSVEVESGVVQASESGQALDDILVAVESVSQQMADIANAAERMSASVNEMVSAMDTVSAVVEENTAATEEMAASADEVAQAFNNIANISEENSAATQEVSATTEEVTAQAREVSVSAQALRQMAQELEAAVAQFKS